MAKLSLRDFCKNSKIAEKAKDFPGIGQIIMKDIGIEQGESLKDFYSKNYFDNYILANPVLFNWMFKNNGGTVAVLLLNNKILAHQGHVPVIFTDGADDYKGFISASTMVDIDYRRRGLMSYLRGSVHDRYEMAVSLGGSDQGITLYTSMGYRYYGDLIRLIAVVDPKKCEEVSMNCEGLQAIVSLSNHDEADVRQIEQFAEIDQNLEQLRNSVLSPNKYFGVKRDAEFLDWRYIEHPIFKYERFGLWADGSLRAFIVYRKELARGTVSTVIRITELIGEDNYIPQLIKSTVLQQKTSADVSWIDFFCSHSQICGLVSSLGFKTPEELRPCVFPVFCNPIDYNKKKYPFMFWSRDESFYAKLPKFNDWYITKGDGDADRPN